MTIYRGVGGVNREIKQQFRGIGGVNSEIKEQYRGVGGVNRKVFSKRIGGIDVNTLLMLHADTFTDSSQYSNAYTSNTLTLNTFVKKFGTSSFYCNGHKMVFPADDNWRLSTTDYTIEFWFYFDAFRNDFEHMMGVRNSSVCAWYVGAINDKLIFGVQDSGGAWAPENLNIATIFASTWYHFAMTRTGSTIKIYLNGTLIYSTTSAATTYISGANQLTIGTSFSDGTWGYTYNGYLDEIRISNIVRWTTNFTPFTQPYDAG